MASSCDEKSDISSKSNAGVRKRRRTSSGSWNSDRLSNQSIQEKISHFQSPEWHKKEDVEPTDCVCLYETEEDHLPAYIKKGQNGAVLKCSYFEGHPFPLLDLDSVDREQQHKIECIFACADKMFMGLSMGAKQQQRDARRNSTKKWEDTDSSMEERYEKSLEEESKFHGKDSISCCLRQFYISLLKGFQNGYARNGLQRILDVCVDVLSNVPKKVIVDNIGGTASGYDGNVGVAKVYHQFNKNCTEDKMRSIAKFRLSADKAERKDCVPDLALSVIRGGEQSFFLFAECQAMEYITTDISTQMFSQIWHQSLRGLYDNECSYGCLVDGFEGRLLKMEIKNDVIETYIAKYTFYQVVEKECGITYYLFNIGPFLNFLKALLKIIQDNLQ